MRIFERLIFWLVLKLGISYRVIIYLEGFWFLLEEFLMFGYNVNGKATV
jgi:hypothetical protein